MPSTDDTPTHHLTATGAKAAPRSHLAAFATSVAALLLVVLLSACNGAGASDSDEPTEAAEQADVATEAPAGDRSGFRTADSSEEEVCEGGELTIGELAAVDAVWQERRDGFAEQAAAWQADARLIDLGIFCWLDPDPEIAASYYSPTTDGYFNAPDGDEIPVTLSETAIDPAAVSFTQLRDWLLAAGYDESAVTAGVGLDSTKDMFDLPGDRLYFHVALLDASGESITSLVIDAETGVVEEAEAPGTGTPESA